MCDNKKETSSDIVYIEKDFYTAESFAEYAHNISEDAKENKGKYKNVKWIVRNHWKEDNQISLPDHQ